MSNSIKATVFAEGFAEVSVGSSNRTKKISIKDYATVINSLVAEEDQNITTSTFRYPSSIHSLNRTNHGYIVNLYFNERIATLSHTRIDDKEVYMPNVMIRVQLMNVKGKPGEFSIGNVHWFATDKPRVALPTEWPTDHHTRDHIWTLPMPNMFSDARMCVGSNRLPSVIYTDWTVLDQLYNDLLIGSEFNNDLNVPCVEDMPSRGDRYLQALAEYTASEGTERFPYEKLVNY